MVLKWLFSKSKVSLPKNFRASIDPEALKIVERLQKAGHLTYLVGGCVRDILLNKKPKDFDIATSATPNQVKSLIHRSFIIGRRFRIVVAKRRHHSQPSHDSKALIELFPTPIERLSEKEFQITTFRREPEKINADEVNENVFGSPKEDALRRDFTINALFLDPQKAELVDFVSGMSDLAQKKLKIIGDPHVRFSEDPIRILRAVRFQCRTGFQFEAQTKKGLTDSIPSLKDAKRERIREEFLKALREGHIAEFFKALHQLKIWPLVSKTFESLWESDQKHAGYFERLSEALADHAWHRTVQSPLVYLALFPLLYDSKQKDEKKLNTLIEELKISRAELEDLYRIQTLLKKLEKDSNAEHPTRVIRPNIRYYESDSQAFYCLMILSESKVAPFQAIWKAWKPAWEKYLIELKQGSTPSGSAARDDSDREGSRSTGPDGARRRRRRRRPTPGSSKAT